MVELAKDLGRPLVKVSGALLSLERRRHVLREVGKTPAEPVLWRLAPPGPRNGEAEAACSVCSERFLAIRSPQGRWPKTCGPGCQATSLDRMIAALVKRRDALLEAAAARGRR